MKIGILGTRGIPNRYGGFEQFAEYLSLDLIKRGHEVTVYNSSLHFWKKNTWNDVKLIHCKDPENYLGTFGQFIYDYNCIIDSRKRDFDILLQLGYNSNSIWSKLLSDKYIVITNMDGLEWKRSKFNKPTRKFLQYAEKLAVKSSDYLVSDSIGIQQYLKEKYNANSYYIPYGANAFEKPDKSKLEEFDLLPFQYDMLIARLEPENNIETILSGYTNSSQLRDFLVIGHDTTAYALYLKNKFPTKRIRFLGPIYDIEKLNNLRYFSNLYFHGHSVGGTNPSLLEAMASSALICAHDNIFNKSILEDAGFYFKSSEDITSQLNSILKAEISSEKVNLGLTIIKKKYFWKQIIDQYERCFLECIAKKKAD